MQLYSNMKMNLFRDHVFDKKKRINKEIRDSGMQTHFYIMNEIYKINKDK